VRWFVKKGLFNVVLIFCVVDKYSFMLLNIYNMYFIIKNVMLLCCRWRF